MEETRDVRLRSWAKDDAPVNVRSLVYESDGEAGAFASAGEAAAHALAEAAAVGVIRQ